KALLRLRHAERTARDEQQRRSELLDMIHEPFLLLEKDWRLAYVSAKGAQLLRKKHEPLFGRDFWGVVPGGKKSPFHEPFQRAMAERSAVEFEAFSRELAGWFEIRISPYQDGLLVFI